MRCGHWPPGSLLFSRSVLMSTMTPSVDDDPIVAVIGREARGPCRYRGTGMVRDRLTWMPISPTGQNRGRHLI
jgi:hypothetical protein